MKLAQYNGPKEREDRRSTLVGRLLCAAGLHAAYFSRYWKGFYRPDFRCRRKGCQYWNG